MDDRFSTPGYESLADVLARAYEQAATGKGAERHACARPFTDQPMQTISSLLGSKDGLLYQAMKKIQESQRMDKDAAIRELLGAINYIAGAIIWMEAKSPPVSGPTPGQHWMLPGSRESWSIQDSKHCLKHSLDKPCPLCMLTP